MPEEGIDLMAHEDVLSFEEIVNFVKETVKTGIIKNRSLLRTSQTRDSIR
jgi:cyclic pyranopterin phosphate synthase